MTANAFFHRRLSLVPTLVIATVLCYAIVLLAIFLTV